VNYVHFVASSKKPKLNIAANNPRSYQAYKLCDFVLRSDLLPFGCCVRYESWDWFR